MKAAATQPDAEAPFADRAQEKDLSRPTQPQQAELPKIPGTFGRFRDHPPKEGATIWAFKTGVVELGCVQQALERCLGDRLMTNWHRTWLALGLLAIVLLVGACGATGDGTVTQGDATHGRSLWAQSACASCHGVSAQGSRAGPALANTPLTLGEVTNITRRGGPGMPKYSASQISDQELQDVYAWLQNPVPAATRELEQDPWTQSTCAGCHGVDALGGIGPSLAGTSQPFAAFQTVVRQGAEGMPAYSVTQISDETLQAMYAWLQAQAQVPAAQPTLWVQAGCSACHGANAEGASATALAGKEFSYDKFQQVVRGGEEGMPAYNASQIGDMDLQRMYNWLMALP